MNSSIPHRPAIRWAALAFGIGLLSFPTLAHASNWDGFGETVVIFIFSTVVLSTLFGLGILIPVAIMGRRSAPLAPWKRTVGVLGIVFASLCTAWNLIAALILLTLWSAIAKFVSGPDTSGLLAGVTLLLAVVPLATSVFAIVYSAKLYGRNKTAWAR